MASPERLAMSTFQRGTSGASRWPNGARRPANAYCGSSFSISAMRVCFLVQRALHITARHMRNKQKLVGS
jgi:hypothetical protein